MNLPTFVVRNGLRNKKRTALTILSIGFSLFLLLTLMTFLDKLLNPPATEASTLRLATRRSTSLADQMPLAYQDRIASLPHVKEVVPMQWFGGFWKEEKNFFANFAVDPPRLLTVFPELEIPEDEKKAFLETRNGVLVGKDLMKKFDWKLGDVITLQGTIFPFNPELQIVATFTHPEQSNMLYFSFDYFNQALGEPNTIGSVWILADSPEAIAPLADAVDGLFKNSPAETKTETEKAFRLGFVSMLGNVQALIGGVAGAVVFTMMLVAISTMAMIVRERYREVGILKSMGYPARLIMLLLVAESIFISMMAAALGMGGGFAMRFLDVQKWSGGFVPKFETDLKSNLMVLAVGLAIGIISGIPPAWMASRLTITGAIRRLE